MLVQVTMLPPTPTQSPGVEDTANPRKLGHQTPSGLLSSFLSSTHRCLFICLLRCIYLRWKGMCWPRCKLRRPGMELGMMQGHELFPRALSSLPRSAQRLWLAPSQAASPETDTAVQAPASPPLRCQCRGQDWSRRLRLAWIVRSEHPGPLTVTRNL